MLSEELLFRFAASLCAICVAIALLAPTHVMNTWWYGSNTQLACVQNPLTVIVKVNGQEKIRFFPPTELIISLVMDAESFISYI